MAMPIVVGSLSFTVMQFADQIMVSWLGMEALAAVGSAGIWSFTLAVFFTGIAKARTYSVVVFRRFRSEKWRHIKIFSDDPAEPAESAAN